jgi:hypothetical protein
MPGKQFQKELRWHCHVKTISEQVICNSRSERHKKQKTLLLSESMSKIPLRILIIARIDARFSGSRRAPRRVIRVQEEGEAN